MIKGGVAETKENNIRKLAYQELLDVFKERIKNIPLDNTSHMAWMQGPSNINRCREIGMTTREVLDMLRKDCLKEEHENISPDE